MTLRVIDMFAGIGGFSLGLHRAGGFETTAFCEIDKHSCKVLERHWPDVPNLGDVTTAEFPDAEVICAGFPCQDISLAGKGAGLAGARSGLWREVVRAIRLVRPRFALLENVAALLGRGMGRVLGDLAEERYDAEWDCIPAFAVGALHYRDRTWIIAYPDTNRLRPQRLRPAPTGAWCKQQFERLVQDQVRLSLPAGRRSGISDGVSDRMGQLKAYGNAVVPQIPELIGRAILAAEQDSIRGAETVR
jgi:DNA (cytosine-5)-methyltransferase 1